MNRDTNSHGELIRPATNPATIFAAETQHLPAGVPLFHSGLAKPASANTPSPLSILRALHRKQLLALGVAILLAGICGPAAYYLVPPAKYKAQSRLQVAAQTPKVLFSTVETERGNDDYKRYQNTQQALVTSPLALSAALRDEKISKCRMLREQVDQIGWLQANLKVECIPASELMEISLSGEYPQDLADIVNAVTKAYIDEVANKDTKERMARFEQLKKLKTRYADMLKDRRETLRKLAQTVGSDDRETLAYGAQLQMEHQARVRNELEGVQSEKRKLQARLRVNGQRPEENREETSAPSISEADIDGWIDRDPAVAKLTATLAQEEEKLNSESGHIYANSRKPSADPVLRRIRQDMAATQKLLKSKRAALRPIAIRELQQNGTSGPTIRAGGIEQELAILDDLEQQLTAQLKSVSDNNLALTNKTLDLQSLQDEIAQMQASALKVIGEVEALDVELTAPRRIQPTEDAKAPLTRDEKKRYVMIGLIVFGSFFGGLFGVAFLELQNQKVDSADEVPANLGLHVVGTLPIMKPTTSRGLPLVRRRTERDRYWKNVMMESIDATRTMLIHTARTGSHRVVMIASAVGGEGKTSLSSHLATSLACSGLRTLLIDADLRSPSIHRLFNLPVAPGLAEVVRGEADLAGAIAATTIEELKILTAGRCDRGITYLLSQGCLGPLFAQLKEQFDFVLVDSSPLLPVADGLVIAQYVDAVLFSIFRDVSRRNKVAAALERLQCLRVPILGAVVTGAHGGRYGTDYDSGSAYRLLPEVAADPSSSSSEPS
jgi:capsular exopolysaccharide synthesis family protein